LKVSGCIYRIGGDPGGQPVILWHGFLRTAFISIGQTEPLMARKITVRLVVLGGEKGPGAKVGEMVRMVATHAEVSVRLDCGHFLPKEAPDAMIEQIAMAAQTRS
jgi:pimeloyl-ACP methyl ester carboxylesterase